MLIRRAVIEEIGLFDHAFGRGYAEENDFSLRAADRGWRHVAAGGVLVRHAEARSFGAEKAALVARNLEILAQRFPEYPLRVARFAAIDPIRRLRWPLDAHRLRAFAADRRFWLVIDNWLDGGTARAAEDIAALVQPADALVLRVTGQQDGHVVLTADGLALHAVFAANEGEALFAMLAALPIARVVVHHLLGFTQDVIEPLRRFLADHDSVFHVHDFYYACPRVTLIDASGSFCGGASADRCDRCLTMDGAHHAHRLDEMPVAEHRALFQSVLAKARHVVAPSLDAASRLAALMPGIEPIALPHPQTGTTFPIGVRRGGPTDICLLGAIGPHKGSHTLLALARHAALNHPDFRFHVIGFTNIDDDLEAIGNVTVTGRYEPEALAGLVDRSGARIALFLHGWPETFSYTLTEAVEPGADPRGAGYRCTGGPGAGGRVRRGGAVPDRCRRGDGHAGEDRQWHDAHQPRRRAAAGVRFRQVTPSDAVALRARSDGAGAPGGETATAARCQRLRVGSWERLRARNHGDGRCAASGEGSGGRGVVAEATWGQVSAVGPWLDNAYVCQ